MASRLLTWFKFLKVCPEDESVIMTSVVNTMTSLSIKQVEQKELFDFRAMRLDWFRLQVKLPSFP